MDGNPLSQVSEDLSLLRERTFSSNRITSLMSVMVLSGFAFLLVAACRT